MPNKSGLSYDRDLTPIIGMKNTDKIKTSAAMEGPSDIKNSSMQNEIAEEEISTLNKPYHVPSWEYLFKYKLQNKAKNGVFKAYETSNSTTPTIQNLETLKIHTVDPQAKNTSNPHFKSKLIAVDHHENILFDDDRSAAAVDEEIVPTPNTQAGSLDILNDDIFIHTHKISY